MTVTERFLKYVTFETTSDESSDTVPSTATQLVLADYLVEELRGAGVTDAMRDEMGYVYGHIPASDGCEKCPKIGLVSHMDTSPDVSGANVKPQIIKFDGTNAPREYTPGGVLPPFKLYRAGYNHLVGGYSARRGRQSRRCRDSRPVRRNQREQKHPPRCAEHLLYSR